MEKNYDAVKKLQVTKFQDRLNHMLNSLYKKGINIKVPNIEPFNIEFIDEINEEQMKDVIIENVKSAYSPHTKTIYIYNSFENSPQFEYHFTKRMLEHISTKLENGRIASGVSIKNGKNTFNESLNLAIIESITNTMLGNETIDEDTFKNYIIERYNLGLIETIVGLETILNSFFNSDYLMLESKFNSYNVEYKDIAKLMDKLTKVNYDLSYVKKEEDNDLESKIFKLLIEAYAKRFGKEKNLNGKEKFKENIVNSQTVRGTFGTANKFGYKDVDRNIITYELVMSGLESAYTLSNNESVTVKK